MAEIIQHNSEQTVVSGQNYFWRNLLVGATMGFLYWGGVAVTDRTLHNLTLSGDLVAIIVATVGIVVMINLRMTQPLMVAAATGLSLARLAGWVDGLSTVESAGWSVLIFAAAYTLFGHLARITRTEVFVVLTVVVVLSIRLLSNL